MIVVSRKILSLHQVDVPQVRAGARRESQHQEIEQADHRVYNSIARLVCFAKPHVDLLGVSVDITNVFDLMIALLEVGLTNAQCIDPNNKSLTFKPQLLKGSGNTLPIEI